MPFSARLHVPLALVAAALILGCLPISAAKPSETQVVMKKSDPLSDPGFKDYVTRFNPFNGTDAVSIFSPERAAAVLSAFGQTSYGGKQARKEARYNYWSCLSGWWNYGGKTCMYDYTAKVRVSMVETPLHIAL